MFNSLRFKFFLLTQVSGRNLKQIMIELKLNIAKKKNTILQFEINCKLLPKIGAIPFAIVVDIDIYEIILSNAFFENKSF